MDEASSNSKPKTAAVSKLLQDKQKEWDAVKRTRPTTLLDLPVDILRLVVKEITHTNDLTALALTNSTLHNLAIPHIYARFDIVWPDAHVTASDPKSVDALTYGLSTLCLGSAFARTMQRLRRGTLPKRQFKGNEYAKYTRKFSLGNGPSDWVAEYSVSKESGKMLGTLVALALDKMVNLESFVWDMPTGVLSDSFMALGALPEHHPNNECKLERVWIRWHDNSATHSSASPPIANTPASATSSTPVSHHIHPTPVGVPLPANSGSTSPKRSIKYSQSPVEYPTFSVLPPLRSLTVLNIDELAYLDEMSVLVERSKDCLQELRVGISVKAVRKDFVEAWDGPGLRQVDHNARWPGESTIGEKRLGGVLGVLVGRIYDIRRRSAHSKEKESPRPAAPLQDSALSSGWSYVSGPDPEPASEGIAAQSMADEPGEPPADWPNATSAPGASASKGKMKKQKGSSSVPGNRKSDHTPRPRLEGKLKLHTLELERVPLSMQVCTKAIDWPVLNNLTLLDCPHHESLWRILRKQFEPSPLSGGFGISANSKPAPDGARQYYLNLKRLQTDITSYALINFIKETLAPNSLDVLFLQDRRRTALPPPVNVDAVFKAVRRHRASLRQLLLDSTAKGSPSESNRWKSWILNSKMMTYLCRGRMPNLRELAISLHYKDWHLFIQRLRNMPQLRSLHIPNIAEYVTGAYEPRDLAMQIVNIITVCPSIQLCYVGIANKCFEILESPSADPSTWSSTSLGNGPSVGAALMTGATGVDGGDEADQDDTSDEDIDEDDDDDDDEDDDETEEETTPNVPDDIVQQQILTDPDATQSEDDPDDGSQESDYDPSGDELPDQDIPLRLREILFYDDKVAIFKARHARL